ncbi:MAG: uroporphyrinogen decarboxylase family protein [Clostridia bacterium]
MAFIEMTNSPVRRPDFANLAAVLERKTPARATLFEYFLNDRLYTRLSGLPASADLSDERAAARLIKAFEAAGYDYATLSCPWIFPMSDAGAQLKSRSLNHPSLISDRAAFERYPWPDAKAYDYGYLDRLTGVLPEGMGIIMAGADGILETTVALVGYENLCMMLYDDEELLSDIFARVGQIILDFYRQIVGYPAVRAILCNDDWGFNTQTLLAPDALRKYVFPWYAQCCRLAHAQGKYAILHSCGVFRPILDDIVQMGFDARHSYEDNIVPVEQAYAELHDKIAVLGGIDVDFLCRSTPEAIEQRARALLSLTGSRGYALGSGNSIPDYVPDESYFALTRAALTP